MKALILCAGLLGVVMSTGAGAGGAQRVDELSEVRGSIVFNTYCVLCHGPKADGKGRAAKNYNPPPANLTTSMRTDAYKQEIVTKGGAAMKRSPFMPPWGQELSHEQINDVVVFLRSVNVSTAVKRK